MPDRTGSVREGTATGAPLTDSLHAAKPFRRQSIRGLGADVFVETLAPNSVGPHRHRQWQIAIVPGGAALEVTWQRSARARKPFSRRITAGELWLLPPGWIHTVDWREPATFIALYLDESWIDSFYPRLAVECSVIRLSEYVAAVPVIADLCRELRQFGETPNGPTDWKVAAVGSHLATSILDAHSLLSGGVFRQPSSLVAEILNKLRRHLAERNRDRLPIKEIARQLGASDRNLRRLFRNAIGMSPQEWLTVEKVRFARQLLGEGRSVKASLEIAGFTSESHLHRAFLRTYGISPAAFRRQSASTVPALHE